MSIAVSAVVRPSRTLRSLVLAYGFANLAAAFAVGFLLPERFVCGPLSSLCLLSVAMVLLSSAVRAKKLRQIDISGLGQVRLTVQQDMAWNDVDAMRGADLRGADLREADMRVADLRVADMREAGEPVALLAGSTVWPQLMLLRFGSAGGVVTVVPVLRDSVAPAVFRPLAVALGAIGGRSQPIFGTHKIL
jgi:Pentapeptide repeats (8 copies)